MGICSSAIDRILTMNNSPKSGIDELRSRVRVCRGFLCAQTRRAGDRLYKYTTNQLLFKFHFQMLSPMRSPEKNSEKPNHNWFEATIHNGAEIRGVIRDAASMAAIPYLRQSANIVINIIDIIQVWSNVSTLHWNDHWSKVHQSLKDNTTHFQTLGEDAAMLMVVLLESYEKAKDQKRWPDDKADLLA